MRARPGISGEESTLPRVDRPVLGPRLKVVNPYQLSSLVFSPLASGPRVCIDVTVHAVPVVSSASRTRIRCRSCARQLASQASKKPCSASARVQAVPKWAPIAPPWKRWRMMLCRSAGTTNWGHHPCPSSSWNRRCRTLPTRYNLSHWRHSTLASRDSGEMSSQWGRSFPAHFHLMMGPISGSASCLADISSGVQPGSHL